MVHEEFNGIVKKPTALHQDNALRALRNWSDLTGLRV
jgi:hypothetical protein